jgi:hypothetical protein
MSSTRLDNSPSDDILKDYHAPLLPDSDIPIELPVELLALRTRRQDDYSDPLLLVRQGGLRPRT